MPVRPLGHPARHLDAVGSTMTEAAAWAEAGAPHGALVTAAHQRAGRGRWGRTWADAPGQSLMLSLVLRPALDAERLGLVALAAGLALAEALDAFGVGARLKWPNDVRVGGRKLAGVLAEATWAGRRPTVVLGAGLNVEQAAFPDALADRATSVRLVTGRPVERLAPLDPFLRRLEARLADAEGRPARLVADIEGRLEQRGETVAVGFPGTDRPPVEGRVVGLAPTGALRLATDAGEVALHAGEVTLAVPS
ncbi:biotin--[acetyl-CoA-carboxylase] ligase [Rubrivirga sp. S365]|uniref:biotin--[acetyl-CoA-carboxylase] ligase n=1 Tax=Rubrivirga sp. S365 TaxID=3076080 RepID=UPI0028C8B47B|nr:biotin--[acetyl-CoA-carboxylase] ligase [Rubrivirga sp. S365]MDT7856164.1 biotin--[acetyl-CoA-carboxylase] ligase [Rubrivirga sp. S365]